MGGIHDTVTIGDYGGLQGTTITEVEGLTHITAEGFASQVQTVPAPDPVTNIYRNGEISLYSILIKPGLMYHKIVLDNWNNIEHSYVMLNDTFKDGNDDITYTAVFTESWDTIDTSSHKISDPVNIYRINITNEDEVWEPIQQNDDINALKNFLQNKLETNSVNNVKFGQLNSATHEDEFYYGRHSARKVTDSSGGTLAGFIWGDINVYSADAHKKIN